ncbi:hypothetical protein D3C80_1584490 [compost metagenome]
MQMCRINPHPCFLPRLPDCRHLQRFPAVQLPAGKAVITVHMSCIEASKQQHLAALNQHDMYNTEHPEFRHIVLFLPRKIKKEQQDHLLPLP